MGGESPLSLIANPFAAPTVVTNEAIARRCREDFDLFTECVIKHERTGKRISQSRNHLEWSRLMSRHDKLIIWGHPESGKALAVDTPLPTPTGWTTMGVVRVGDTVFGSDGHPCSVTAATAVQYGRACYRVTFDDGASLVADADHRWLARTRDDADPRHRHLNLNEAGWRVVTTAEMLRVGVLKSNAGAPESVWRIPLSRPVEFQQVALSIHPYVLGAWLGDGHGKAPILTMHEDDREVGYRCAELNGGRATWKRVSAGSGKCCTLSLADEGKRGPRDGKLRTRLRLLGVIGNKHIPEQYLHGSVEQRRELLAGLLDTDGSVDRKGHVEFCNCTERLAIDVLRLIRSLGFKAAMIESAAVLNGRVVGRRWRINFTPRVPVFRLQRKLARQQFSEPFGRTRYRAITAIDPVESVPVRCIAVDSPDHSYLAGRDFVVTHNSNQLISRILWTLGRDPMVTIAIVSRTHRLAMKMTATVRRYIERSTDYHAIFPHVVPAQETWSDSFFTIKRPFIAKDPSVQAVGVGGHPVGSRLKFLLLDDILDWENTRAQDARDKMFEWYTSSDISGRVVEDGRVVFLGTGYHPDDLMHRLAKTSAWKSERYPVVNAAGQPMWPEVWGAARIEAKRRELEGAPLEYARQFMCVTRSDAESRFKSAWIDLAKERGKDVTMHQQPILDFVGKYTGCRTYTGVDLAVQQHSSADLVVLFTILVYPNGDRQPLWVESGRWSGPDIVDRVIEATKRYRSIGIVENVAAQDYIVQFIRAKSAAPIRPYTTGRGKASLDFQAETLANELAAGKWIIPSKGGVHPEVELWIRDILYFDPAAHTGDRLAASLFARFGAASAGGPVLTGAVVSPVSWAGRIRQ